MYNRQVVLFKLLLSSWLIFGRADASTHSYSLTFLGTILDYKVCLYALLNFFALNYDSSMFISNIMNLGIIFFF